MGPALFLRYREGSVHPQLLLDHCNSLPNCLLKSAFIHSSPTARFAMYLMGLTGLCHIPLKLESDISNPWPSQFWEICPHSTSSHFLFLYFPSQMCPPCFLLSDPQTPKLESPCPGLLFSVPIRQASHPLEPQLKCWFFREAQTPICTSFVFRYLFPCCFQSPPLDCELREGRAHTSLLSPSPGKGQHCLRCGCLK